MKRFLLSAVIAGVLIALSIPSLAAAEKPGIWRDTGVPITNDVPLGMKGNIFMSGGIACNAVEIDLLLHPSSSTGLIERFDVLEPGKCEINGSLKAFGCTSLAALTAVPAEGGSAENLNWVLHNTTHTVVVEKTEETDETGEYIFHHRTDAEVVMTGFKFLLHYNGGAFCPKTVTTAGGLTALPNDLQEIDTFLVSGGLTSSLGTVSTFSGTFGMRDPEDEGTYGLLG